MASSLNNKIKSYAIERGIEFSESVKLNPLRDGTLLQSFNFSSSDISLISYDAGDAPPFGDGSWKFQRSTAAATNFRQIAANTSGGELVSVGDNDWSLGFWFKVDQLALGTSVTEFVIFQLGGAGQLLVTLAGQNNTIQPNNLRVSSVTNSALYTTAQVEAGKWMYFAIRVTTSTVEVYLNGDLQFSAPRVNNTTAADWYIGKAGVATDTLSWNFSNYYLASSSVIGPTEIRDIWLYGMYDGKVNISAAPMTANSESLLPSLTLIRNINYNQNSIIVTALQTQPTIVIVNYDNVQITTSIPVDAVFPDATVTVETNISNVVAPMTASVESPQHVNIAGTGIIFTAFPATANSDFINVAFFGSGNQNLPSPALTANAVFPNATTIVPENYRNLVKRHQPPFYANSPDRGEASYLATWKNDGYANWGTYSVDGGVDVNSPNAPYPISSIGNGRAVRGFTRADVNDSWAFINPFASAFVVTPGQDYTAEFWIYTHKSHPRSFKLDLGKAELTVLGDVSNVTNEFNQVIDEIYSNGRMTFRINTETIYEHNFSTAVAEGINPPDFFVPNAWNHVVVTGKAGSYGGLNNLRTQFWINGVLRSTHTGRMANTAIDETDGNGIRVRVSGKPTFGGADPFDYARYYVTEVAVYDQVLSNAEIVYHYDFVTTLSPNRLILPDPMENVSSFLMEPTVVGSRNLNYPETPVIASADIVNPSLETTVGDIFDAEPFIASALMVDEIFAGDPDAIIVSEPLTAYAEAGPNVYRLDTKYFSYVQNIIAPHRYVTFDSPDNLKDWGSDNDYANAAPFVYSGEITSSVDGLANNSLLTDGLDYNTSGVIFKESEWDDDWGTGLGSYHSSYWIRKDITDTAPNGLRIIQCAFSPFDNAFGILYQYNNQIHFQIFNGTDYFTASSTIGVNVFDYSKHHVVVNFRITGINHFVDIYVDKQLVISQNVGTQTLAFRNSDTFLPPNTEANNLPRMSVGALIVPIELTSLPVNPTPSKMYIDEVHWAQTSIIQAGVTALYDEMPFKNPITFFADPMLSLTSEFIDPTFGVGSGINSVPATAESDMFTPTVELQLQPVVVADIMEASAEVVEPFSVVADNITNIEIVSDIFVASAELLGGGVLITIPGPTMYASAVLVTKTPYFDPYHLLVFQQSRLPLGTSFAGRWGVGDLD
jgi:hypothetical protein